MDCGWAMLYTEWLWLCAVTCDAGLEMATDTVTNATKMVQLATRSFQAVAELATSSKLTIQLKMD